MLSKVFSRLISSFAMSMGILMILKFVYVAPASAADPGLREFYNDSTIVTLTLRKRSTPPQETTLLPLESKKLPVSLGDVFDVVTAGPEKASPIFINHLDLSYPIVILPEEPYREIDPRGNHVFMGRDLATAYFGFDLRKFNSRDIVSSTGSGRIFRGLQPETTEYELLAAGYVPRGCGYGDRNRSQGEDSYEKIFTHDAFMKTWDIGISGDIPLGTSPASLGLNFAYGETETRTATTNSVYIVNHKKDIRYFVNCDPLGENGIPNDVTPLFTQGFVRGVQRVRDAASANSFVNRFGTHYPAEVNYGGHRSSWVIIEESDYYEGLEQRVDFAAEVKVAAGSQKVAVAKPPNSSNPFDDGSTTTTTSNNQTSPGGSGGLNFSQVQKKEARDLLQKSKSHFWAAGGEGALVGAWNVPSESAIPVSVVLKRIDKLVRPELFRSPMTEADLRPKRDLIKAAVDRAEDQIPTIPKPEQKRGFRFRFRKIKFEVDVDDLSHEMKGDITLITLTNPPTTITLWSSNGGWVNPRRAWESPGKWVEFEQKPEANGNYAPLILLVSAQLLDNDAGTGDTCQDGRPHCDDKISVSLEDLAKQIPLDGLDGMKTVNFKMKGFKTHAEKTTLDIEVQIQPMARIGNQPGGINLTSSIARRATVSAPTGSATKRAMPAEHDPRQTVLDPTFYLNHHPDLKNALGTNHAAARNHWLQKGIREGRQSSAAFSIKDYVARYPDVQRAHGTNYAAALDHWLTTGKKERRDPRPASGSTPPAPVVAVAPAPATDSFQRIQNVWHKDHYIHNQNGVIEVGPAPPNWWSAQWKLVPAHSGWVRIQNRWYPDRYIHNQNGKLEIGPIQSNWASALWKLVPAHSGWVRIQNVWHKDNYIHNQNGRIEVGPIQPNWASALWKLE